MTREEAIAQIVENFNEIAKKIFDHVMDEMQGKPWVSAVTDRRFGPEGGSSSIGKYRIVLPDGSRKGFEYVAGVGPLIIESFNLRKSHLPVADWWYGVLLTIYPDGGHRCEFNYDPLCVQNFDLKS